MRADIEIDRGGETHTEVKEYAEEHSIRLPRAYAELIKRGLEQYAAEQEQDEDGDSA